MTSLFAYTARSYRHICMLSTPSPTAKRESTWTIFRFTLISQYSMTIDDNHKMPTVLYFARGVLEFARQCWLTSDEKIVRDVWNDGKYVSGIDYIEIIDFCILNIHNSANNIHKILIYKNIDVENIFPRNISEKCTIMAMYFFILFWGKLTNII